MLVSRVVIALLTLPWVVGCVGNAGGDLFEFEAYGKGPDDAIFGEPYRFTTGRDYQVQLDRAVLHVGALYLNRAQQTSVGSDTSCTLPGIYSAEVTTGRDLDLLSSEQQPFPELGHGTDDTARTGEVWLTGGDVYAESDPTVIFDVKGSAEKDGIAYPFSGKLTISTNRKVTPQNPALPGSKPLCKERVVSPIAMDLSPVPGASLVLTVDPQKIFANVEFSELERIDDDPPEYRIRDDDGDQPSLNVYNGIRASVGVYAFDWRITSK